MQKGQSAPFVLDGYEVVDVGEVTVGNFTSIANKLNIAPASKILVGQWSTEQLTVSAAFVGGTTSNVTAKASGTTYISSNPAVATVSVDGLVTAVGSGTAIITAQNNGATGSAAFSVRSGELTALDVVPGSINVNINPAFITTPIFMRTLGTIANGGIDLTLATSGTTYEIMNQTAPNVLSLTPDGVIFPFNPGSATVRVRNGLLSVDRQVDITSFIPIPTGVFKTPGFAHDVDVQGSYIYVAVEDWNTGGLQIVSRDGSTLSPVGKVSYGGCAARDIKVRGALAAIALDSCGVALVDISKVSSPRKITTIGNIGVATGVWISGNSLYVASSSGMRLYNISNQQMPQYKGAVSIPNATSVSGDSTRQIVVFLTSEPAVYTVKAPSTGAWSWVRRPLPWADYQASDVALQGATAFIANGDNGLRRLDVDDPANPVLAEQPPPLPPVPNNPSAEYPSATGVAIRRTPQGTLVAAADNMFVNYVPFFDANLLYRGGVNFEFFPGVIQSDANAEGIALGEDFGVVAVGYAGIQVFKMREVVDNGDLSPTVSISHPAHNSGVTSSVLTRIEAVAWDDTSVSSVEFLVDGVTVGVDTTAPFEAVYAPGTPCTTEEVLARAEDGAGNLDVSLPMNVSVLCAEGQPCASDSNCANGVCINGVCQAPCNLIYSSCADLKDECPTAPSGTYPIDPDGGGPQPAFQVWCDMTTSGGGWTLAAKLTNQDVKNWVNAKSSWTGSNFYGNTQDLSANQDAKSLAWGTVSANEIMLKDNMSHPNDHIVTISNCLGSQTLSQFFTTALAAYPTNSGQIWHKQCEVENYNVQTAEPFVPGWTYTPNVLDDNPASPNISLTSGYATIGRSDGADTYAVLSFYTINELLVGPAYDPVTGATGEFEADVGLAASARNLSAFNLTGEAQDIGGPLSCSFNDVLCRADYPQTVFLFIR